MASPESLIRQVEDAWRDVPYPGDSNIGIGSDNGDDGVPEYFANTSWRGHSTENLRAYSSGLGTFFSAEAYRYWLPAYLIAAVQDPEELSQGLEALVWSVAPQSWWSKFQQERHARIMRLMSREQILATTAVLEHVEGLVEEGTDAVAYLRSKL